MPVNLIHKLRNTLQYHYYKKKNGWDFPPNMAHTSGARVADGTYEPDLTNCICNNVAEGGTVIDIGANVGYYTRLFARLVGGTGRVVAFEIESENYRCLSNNVAEFNNVTPVAMAVSNKNTISEVQKSSHASCHSILKTGNFQESDFFKVASVKLDAFWDLYLDRAPIDCIKMDVEGAEALVLEGMECMLEQHAVKTLIVELCPQIILNSGLDPMELYEKLVSSFDLKVVESEYRDVVGEGWIENRRQFEKLSKYLLEKGNFINCNLFCGCNNNG